MEAFPNRESNPDRHRERAISFTIRPLGNGVELSAGFEPAAFGLKVQHSTMLSYESHFELCERYINSQFFPFKIFEMENIRDARPLGFSGKYGHTTIHDSSKKNE